jgi:hypothetical protein
MQNVIKQAIFQKEKKDVWHLIKTLGRIVL